MTKRELQDDNDALRQKLEEAYDVLGEALEVDDEENPRGVDDRESDESDR